MAGQFEALKDLELTREEVERLGTALKDKEFRKLLCDYVDEIKDPENQKIYQQEITQLEKERGYDVTFINPTAGYVIKTSVDGSKKAFINICANENIQKPTSSPMMLEGTKGLQWSLPHSLTPPREDIDKKGARCVVYDVVFHPDTLYLARNNKAFLNMVNKTACEAVESNFAVKLDCKNLKFPKMQYKGLSHPAMLRKPSNTQPEKLEPEEQEILDKLYESMPKIVEQKSPKKYKIKKEDNINKYTTPKYSIKHRSHVEFEEFTEHKTSKINSATPKELVIEINLPLLRSADDIELDVTEKSVELSSEKPSKYKLHLALPYSVCPDSGNAKFDKDTKKLVITLPVKRKQFFELSRDDSGVESDHGSPVTEELLSSKTSENSDSDFRTNAEVFLNANTHYTLPEHSANVFENILAFTLQVKNVDESLLRKKLTSNSIHIKFATVSSGFYSIDYAFYAEFPENHTIQEDNVQIEVWDNNIVVQIPFDSSDITSYLSGLNSTDVEKKLIDEPIIWNNILESKEPTEKVEKSDTSKKCAKRSKNVIIEEIKIDENENKAPISKAIDISGAVSESSGDELSCSYSPSKCKGILKRFSCSRSSVSRSISESSIDDVLWASSFENCHTSLDSVIPEDGEISSSLKKTVRFNDVVLKQSYRSNSSILGQKKKNQRKARNKKRAQERRHSESELSELDEHKERDSKTVDEKDGSPTSDVNEEEEEEDEENNPHENIFDLDF